MPLPATGPITLAQIATEFAKGNNLAALYNAAAGIPASGAISMGMFRGLSAEFTLNIASDIANPNIRQLALNAGWNGTSKVKVNITAQYINTLNLLAEWSFPGGLEITISSGTLVGGVRSGGTALTASIPVSIRNLGSICGGGGQGGTGETWVVYYGSWYGYGYGGAGGQGQGFLSPNSLTVLNAENGGGGSFSIYQGSLFGGHSAPWARGGSGGVGGNWGTAGGGGYTDSWGGSTDYGPYWTSAGVGSPAGNSVVGNSNITWIATGTRLGPVI